MRFPVNIEEQAELSIARAHGELDKIIAQFIDELEVSFVDNGARVDGLFDEIIILVQRLSEKLTKSRFSASSNRFVERIASRLARETREQIGVANIVPNERVTQAMRNRADISAALIRDVPLATASRIADTVFNGVQNGLTHRQLSKLIEADAGISKRRARTIARDQTGKLYAEAQKVTQQSTGINYYTWSTSNDSRVRDTHASKEGETFSWDNPPSDTGHPGEDINCRCVAIPLVE